MPKGLLISAKATVWYGLGVMAAYIVCSVLYMPGAIHNPWATLAVAALVSPALATAALLVAGQAIIPFAIGIRLWRREEPKRLAALMGIVMGTAIFLQLWALVWFGVHSQVASLLAFFGVISCGCLLARFVGSQAAQRP